MAPYLIAFAFSACFFELGKNIETSRYGKYWAAIFYSLGVLTLCVVAGARDLNVGTDTAGYGIFLFNQGVDSVSFQDFTAAIDDSPWDVAPLFALYVFAVIKLFGSQFVYFFAIELAIVVPIVLVARRGCNRYMGIVMLLYMLTSFIPSLNMMRQSVAIGLVLLSTIEFMDGRFVLAAVCELAATQVHTSALMGLSFWILILFFFKRGGQSGVWLRRNLFIQRIGLLTLFTILSLIFFEEISAFFSGNDSVGRLFLYGTHSRNGYGMSELAYLTALMVGSILLFVQARKGNDFYPFCYMVMLSVSLPFYVLSGIDTTIGRMMEYCVIFVIPFVCYFLSNQNRPFFQPGIWCIVGACAFRFFFCFVYKGFNEAIPYVSTILGIS